MTALDRLRQGSPVYGLIQTYPDSTLTELAAWCGFDFVIIDSEHGVADERAQIQALQTLGPETFGLVRVRTHDSSAVARYLDFGAHGILVPDVRALSQARDIAFAARERWTGGLRGDRYGLGQAFRPLVLVLIESREGARNAADILALDGIDGAIPGSGDLSTDLGDPGNFTAPAYVQALEAIEAAARKHGKILGGKPYPSMELPVLLARGYRFLMIGRDMALVKSAFAHVLADAKATAAQAGH